MASESTPVIDGELDEIFEYCNNLRQAPVPANDALPAGFTGTIGHFPVYFPEAIAHSVGLLPVATLGGGNKLELKHADAHMGSFICSICRSTTAGDNAGTFGCGLHQHLGCAMLADYGMVQGAVLQADLDQVAARLIHRLLHGDRNFLGLAFAHRHAAIAIANHRQCGESHDTATLHHLGDTVHGDHLLDQTVITLFL